MNYNKKYNIYSPIHQYVDYFVDAIHSGSRVICNPPPTDTDDDWLCLVDKEILKKFEEKLISDGFKIGGSLQRKIHQTDYMIDGGIKEYYVNSKQVLGQTVHFQELEEYPYVQSEVEKGKAFRSYKKDDLNIILTISPDYFENFNKATNLCKGLNLLDKHDRIMVIDAICYDFFPDSGPRKKSIDWGLSELGPAPEPDWGNVATASPLNNPPIPGGIQYAIL